MRRMVLVGIVGTLVGLIGGYGLAAPMQSRTPTPREAWSQALLASTYAFKPTKVSNERLSSATLHGLLTIDGVEAPVILTVSNDDALPGSNTSSRLRLHALLKAADFGLQPAGQSFGVPATFQVSLEIREQKSL